MFATAYPTPERLSIVGSAYRRLAMAEASTNNEKGNAKEHLRRSSAAYARAVSEPFPPSLYPRSQWVLNQLLDSWSDLTVLKKLSGSLGELQSLLDTYGAGTLNFWQRVDRADFALLESLHGIAVAPAPKRAQPKIDHLVAPIAEKYLAAFKRGATWQERRSVTETLEVVRIVLGIHADTRSSAKAAIELVKAIETRLQ